MLEPLEPLDPNKWCKGRQIAISRPHVVNMAEAILNAQVDPYWHNILELGLEVADYIETDRLGDTEAIAYYCSKAGY